jgi:hypothetical protein
VGDSLISKSKLRCRTLRALGLHSFIFLGFHFVSPQALCFHPLRGPEGIISSAFGVSN